MARLPYRLLQVLAPAGALAVLMAAPGAAVPVPAAGEPAIAWFPGDVDAAFSRALAEHKPLFLYWGASWCPPCTAACSAIPG